ncbi:MAG: heparan-alpha-glucosaminide N-acetyltransferase domain-containing protein [Bacillota bacterium]|nr:heparan-alpha-glucosaminide N-acetyltransferase domain-containing protein [Bacillota bacterium]
MAEQERISSIDQFRGFAIILMVAANFIAGISAVPAWLKHAPDIGLTITDLVAPMFIFAIGLTCRMSLERRLARDGAFRAHMHMIVRFLAIAGIGAVLAAGESMTGGGSVTWGVLQAIGAAGLINLLVLRRSIAVRIAAGIGLLIVYQVLLDLFFLQDVLGSSHGGLFGSLAWGAMLILSTVVAELYHRKGRLMLFWSVLVLLALATISFYFVPVSKNRVSLSYVLVSTAVSALAFAFFDWLCSRIKKGIPFLAWWGMNPLLLYVLHLLLLGIFVLPGIPSMYAEAPLWLWLLELTFILAVLFFIARILYRKKLIVKL